VEFHACGYERTLPIEEATGLSRGVSRLRLRCFEFRRFVMLFARSDQKESVMVIEDLVLQQIGMSAEEIRVELAVMLFKLERLTLGRASLLANRGQIEFQQLLASRGINIHYDVEEFQQDLSTLRRIGQL
jgi:predicted HTH domain antitoxin